MDCMYDNCCDSVDAVLNGGPATDLQECWYPCSSDDPACASACYEAHPDGIEGFGGWQACYLTQCFPNGPCTSNSPCNQCQYASCSCELARCLANPECFLIYKSCIPNCGPTDAGCTAACADEYPLGYEDYSNFAVCTLQNCIDQCGG
jgi:hypothetical protein